MTPTNPSTTQDFLMLVSAVAKDADQTMSAYKHLEQAQKSPAYADALYGKFDPELIRKAIAGELDEKEEMKFKKALQTTSGVIRGMIERPKEKKQKQEKKQPVGIKNASNTRRKKRSEPSY